MKFETFESIIVRLKYYSEREGELESLGVNTYELSSTLKSIIFDLIKEEYGPEGLDWWEWFCYERNFGERTDLTAYDNTLGIPICETVTTLWAYMEHIKKEQNK